MQHRAVTTDRTIWGALAPARRKALYTVIAAILAAGVAYGAWGADTASQWADVADKTLGALALVLAAIHTGGTYEAPVYPEGQAQ